MEGGVGAIPSDSGPHSDQPPDLAGPRRRKKPARPPPEVEPPSPPAEDYYVPSEPAEEA